VALEIRCFRSSCPRTANRWIPGSKVVAGTETGEPFTIKVVDHRKRTFAEFGVVTEDYRNEMAPINLNAD
jgi:hypothetical protein